jgi:hypothetical protein
MVLAKTERTFWERKCEFFIASRRLRSHTGILVPKLALAVVGMS